MDLRVPITLVRRRPASPLAGMVAGLVGLSERSLEPVTRRQPAGTLIPLVISFGSQLTIDQLSDGEGANRSIRIVRGRALARPCDDQPSR